MQKLRNYNPSWNEEEDDFSEESFYVDEDELVGLEHGEDSYSEEVLVDEEGNEYYIVDSDYSEESFGSSAAHVAGVVGRGIKKGGDYAWRGAKKGGAIVVRGAKKGTEIVGASLGWVYDKGSAKVKDTIRRYKEGKITKEELHHELKREGWVRRNGKWLAISGTGVAVAAGGGAYAIHRIRSRDRHHRR